MSGGGVHIRHAMACVVCSQQDEVGRFHGQHTQDLAVIQVLDASFPAHACTRIQRPSRSWVARPPPPLPPPCFRAAPLLTSCWCVSVPAPASCSANESLYLDRPQPQPPWCHDAMMGTRHHATRVAPQAQHERVRLSRLLHLPPPCPCARPPRPLSPSSSSSRQGKARARAEEQVKGATGRGLARTSGGLLAWMLATPQLLVLLGAFS